ncbi:MAG: CpXC domain-containing protein [Solobacterium sp.]|nr:hypothetical protein [Erysipelotrichaceae bacterium]MBQ9154909.1 CpXC domain-containing protein [Solobacterium sp.]
MSNSRIVSYKCPYCGREFEVEIWDTVTAASDPDLRDRCLSGDLFRLSCPHCKQEFMVQYPLIYIDEDHRFILWLSEKEAPESLRRTTGTLHEKGYVMRRCSTLKEFCEKIQILEDGVSDVMAELAKYDCFIEFVDNGRGTPEEITGVEYQRTENGIMKITVRCSDKGMSFMIPLSMLEEEMNQNPEIYELHNDIFPLVNADWIMSLFEEADGTA